RHESVISHKGHRGHGGMLLLPFLHVVQPGGDSLRFAQHETAVELGREFGVMSLVVHHRDTEDTEVCYCFQSWMLLKQAGIPFALLRKSAQTSLGRKFGVMSLAVHHRDTEDTEECYCFHSCMLRKQGGIPFA